MNFINNIMKSMRLNRGDEYELDDDYDFEDDYEEEQPSRGIFSRRGGGDAYDNEDYEEPKPRLFGGGKSRSQASSAQPRKAAMEVTMIKPTSMDDSRDVCDYLLSGRAVVLNMEGLHMEIAQRIIDFTSGAAYSMGGNLQKISNYIFIATPPHVELSGDFQNILSGNADINMSGGLSLRASG